MTLNLFDSALARRIADCGLQRIAAARVARLDRLNVEAVQWATLKRLLKVADQTRFGRGHCFERIRTPADYREYVPLRTYEDFWQRYWGDHHPLATNLTWPGDPSYFALSSGTTSGATKFIPVTRPMLRSNHKAALTTLALSLAGRPRMPILTGKFFFLGGSTDLRPAGKSLAGDLSGIAAAEASPALRPFTYPPPDVGLMTDWNAKVERMASESLHLPITAVSGVPAWLLVLFERVLKLSGASTLAEAWPRLRLVIHGGTGFEPYRPLFRRVVGEGVSFHETYPCSEGFIATEDPRHELLRVIPDHDIYFEFVPADELRADRPTRLGLWQVETGVNYAVAVTTCAGLWAYLIGDTVRFERRDPPLLRFTGRTAQFLSAFGEHLIGEEVERAVASAAATAGAEVVDFHAGPVFPVDASQPGHHRYVVEFARPPRELAEFARRLDEELSRLNEDYVAHRRGDLSMGPPEVLPVPAGGFAEWMRSRGKLGGQNKVPRLDNTGRVTAELVEWLRRVRVVSSVSESDPIPEG